MTDENETFGPKKGIKLSLSQADLVIKRHFKNKSAESIDHINRGYNNRIYSVRTTTNDEYILRLSGRFWKRCKTENEVAALLYLGAYCPSIPVPKVFGYCTDKQTSGIDAEYILMEKIEGEPLENMWQALGLDDKRRLIVQMVDALAKMRSISFPKIGSFQFEPTSLGNRLGIGVDPLVDITDPVKVIEIGESVDFREGPFETFVDYFRRTSEIEILALKECSFMKESPDYEMRLERIERFIRAFESIDSVPQDICRKALINVPFVFTHGDLEGYNILVDRNTKKLTAILDWEFSGSLPIDEEWFCGLSFLSANTSESAVFEETEPSVESDQTVREYFFSEMKKCGATIPKDIPGHILRAELYYFRGFICPWWLREKRNPIPESHYVDREDACRRIDAILKKYGF